MMGCTFLNNSAPYGRGGAVWLDELTGSVSITHCTFQSNSATVSGTLGLYKLTGNISIMISGGREWQGIEWGAV